MTISVISVVLKEGKEYKVRKDELQYLLATEQILFFERSNGWAVVGRDMMRDHMTPLTENDRREHEVFAIEN